MGKVNVTLDTELYDEGAVRETVARFAESVDVSIRRRRDKLVVSFAVEGDEADRIAGEFVNIALAESLARIVHRGTR